MTMQLSEFHNALRILHSIDYCEVEQFIDREDWPRFRDHPAKFFLRTDDRTADKLWEVIVSRQRLSQDTAARAIHDIAEGFCRGASRVDPLTKARAM